MLWYQLGKSIGVIHAGQKHTPSITENRLHGHEFQDFNDRMDVDYFTGQFDLTDDGNWLAELEKSAGEKANSFKGTKDFLCCLVLTNKQSKIFDAATNHSKYNDFPHDKKFRCHAVSTLKLNRLEPHSKFYARKIERLKSVTQAMKCEPGNLAYHLTMAN